MLRRIANITKGILDALDQPARSAPRGVRGVAILIVLVTITILSIAVIEFTYDQRVNLAVASNERDKTKAYFMARSAINVSRLLLGFQYALASESAETEDDMGRLIGRAMRRSNFQMYQYVDLLMGPFNSGRIESPVGGISLTDRGVAGFGEFIGEMHVRVLPEDGRINVNNFAKETLEENDLIELCAMVLHDRYDDLFELRDEASGELLDRAAVLQAIIDFIDPNQEGIILGDDCTIEGNAGDELRPYERDPNLRNIRPRNARLTHIDDLYQVWAVTDPFMRAFKEQLTVYGVGRPNLNVATAPIFYSVLCRNVRLESAGVQGRQAQQQGVGGISLCAREPAIAMQVLYFAMALDGIRAFFENPLTVLMAYVGTTDSTLLPSARKGQPVGFLTVSQLPAYLNDFRTNPLVMAQFIQYSPTYQQVVMANPAFMIDPLSPQFPTWSITFDRAGLMRSVTTATPKIFRLYATGTYGTTEAKIEAVIDFDKTVRRLPDEREYDEREEEAEEMAVLRELRQAQLEAMPKGRFLFWREY